MYGTTSCGYHGVRGEDFLSVSMDVGMAVFSHYNSMGGVYARDQIQLAQKPH